jgi:hypothetical protein
LRCDWTAANDASWRVRAARDRGLRVGIHGIDVADFHGGFAGRDSVRVGDTACGAAID